VQLVAWEGFPQCPQTAGPCMSVPQTQGLQGDTVGPCSRTVMTPVSGLMGIPLLTPSHPHPIPQVLTSKGDAWAKYMAEVKKYKAHQCGDDDKTRPLVK
jgi:hypothetical protein